MQDYMLDGCAPQRSMRLLSEVANTQGKFPLPRPVKIPTKINRKQRKSQRLYLYQRNLVCDLLVESLYFIFFVAASLEYRPTH